MQKVAVILSGCGVFDGAEIHETCAALLALHRAGAEAVICAPSGPQMHVMNHATGEPAEGESRDILAESARIARGEITPLADLDPNSVCAVLLPGGFGAAKNLCNFATDADACTVHPEVESFLMRAHGAGKTLGAMCIAPVVLARIFGPDLKPRLTIGNDPTTAKLVNSMGAEHVDCAADEIVVDVANRIVTTPAYMLAGNIGEVFDGADKFVVKLLEMCS
ncbi:MAG: isoprenoid biosynthesis glyoxalase ElbB [Candidatus Krumholzibacteria bacterium]|nr:isoprenoid biosynthesis glyoxalase ElbB [Candidatus Krumholzibacteria bacterium]